MGRARLGYNLNSSWSEDLMTKLQALKVAFIEGLMRVPKNSGKEKKSSHHKRPLKIEGSSLAFFFSFPFSTMNISAAKPSGIGLVSFQVIDEDFASARSPDNLCKEKQEITPSKGSCALLPPWLGRPLATVDLCCCCQNASDFHALPWLR